MIFAIDWDNTWTADGYLFEVLTTLINARKHIVIIVTGRNKSHPIEKPDGVLEVIYAGDELKSTAAEKAGYRVDIWIDDEPGHIEPLRKLQF